jgi:hypothetical protein
VGWWRQPIKWNRDAVELRLTKSTETYKGETMTDDRTTFELLKEYLDECCPMRLSAANLIGRAYDELKATISAASTTEAGCHRRATEPPVIGGMKQDDPVAGKIVSALLDLVADLASGKAIKATRVERHGDGSISREKMIFGTSTTGGGDTELIPTFSVESQDAPLPAVRWPHEDKENAIHVGGNAEWDFWIHRDRRRRDITCDVHHDYLEVDWESFGKFAVGAYAECDKTCMKWLAEHPEPRQPTPTEPPDGYALKADADTEIADLQQRLEAMTKERDALLEVDNSENRKAWNALHAEFVLDSIRDLLKDARPDLETALEVVRDAVAAIPASRPREIGGDTGYGISAKEAAAILRESAK